MNMPDDYQADVHEREDIVAAVSRLEDQNAALERALGDLMGRVNRLPQVWRDVLLDDVYPYDQERHQDADASRDEQHG